MTVVPVNVEAVKKAEEEAHETAFRTLNGFTYPGEKTMIQTHAYLKKPDTARRAKLREVSAII